MTKIFAFFYVFIAFSLCAHSKPKPVFHELNYKLDLRMATKGDLHVSLIYKPICNDSSVFIVPEVWGAAKKLMFFQLEKGKGYHKFRFNSDSSEITFYHHQKILLNIEYNIKNGISGKMPLDNEVYFPQIDTTHFSCFSVGMFMAPVDKINGQTKANISFVLPKEWKQIVYGSLGRSLKFKTGIIQNIDIQDYFFTAGEVRAYQGKTATGQNVSFTIRGNWYFKDEEMFSEIKSTLDQQRKFWNDYSTKNFYVSLSHIQSPDNRSLSFTGTGLSNSFAISSYNNMNAQPNSFQYLLHHELMHHWIGKKIRNAEDEELSYWFSEGFTDYFSRMNMLKCGDISEKEYWKTIDSVFLVHYNDKRSEYHNDSIIVHFWDDPFISKIPYNRGSLFALYLDYLLQKKSNNTWNLQRIMQYMLTDEKFYDKPFLKENFVDLVYTLTNVSLKVEVEEYLIQGKYIPIELFAQVLPYPILETEVDVFDLGFTYEKIEGKGKLVKEINSESGISVTNLKVGDCFFGLQYSYNPKIEAKILVERNGEKIWESFYPAKQVKVPQINFE